MTATTSRRGTASGSGAIPTRALRPRRGVRAALAVGKAAGWTVFYAVTYAGTCYGPTFAPPVLGQSSGVPATLGVGGGEVRVGAGIAVASSGRLFRLVESGLGAGQISLAAASWLDVDAGLWGASFPNLNASEGQDGEGSGIVLAHAGVRFHLPHTGVWRGSLSVGGGIGCGGVRGGEEYAAGGCGSGGTGSLAGGGYLGVDIALQLARNFGMFENSRLQVTTARSLPTTFWGAHSFGIQLGTYLVWALEAGPAYFANEADHRVGFFGFASLAYRWGIADPEDDGRPSPEGD
jgi:hypothetical protein